MRVLCTLPNCSEENSGKTFKAAPGGMLSEDMSESEAQRFLSIPGYQAWKESDEPSAGGEGKDKGDAKSEAVSGAGQESGQPASSGEGKDRQELSGKPGKDKTKDKAK